MATTCFFEETITNADGTEPTELEFGRSSYFGSNSLYIRMGDVSVCVDQETAKRILKAMDDLGGYLNLGLD